MDIGRYIEILPSRAIARKLDSFPDHFREVFCTHFNVTLLNEVTNALDDVAHALCLVAKSFQGGDNLR